MSPRSAACKTRSARVPGSTSPELTISAAKSFISVTLGRDARQRSLAGPIASKLALAHSSNRPRRFIGRPTKVGTSASDNLPQVRMEFAITGDGAALHRGVDDVSHGYGITGPEHEVVAEHCPRFGVAGHRIHLMLLQPYDRAQLT